MKKGINHHTIIGCLLGVAIGDALGLPFEGLSPQRQKKLYPQIKGYHFLWGKGMVSDDTEHTVMIAEALLESQENPQLFIKIFAQKLRCWLFLLPAGVGLATLKAISKLLLGFSPLKSGVYSAGNGPLMRSAILGVYWGDNWDKLREFVHLSTIITHTDPKAELGALTVAFTASLVSQTQAKIISPDDYYHSLVTFFEEDTPATRELLALIRSVCDRVKENQASTEAHLKGFPVDRKGISGYSYHTLPRVIHTWLRHQNDYENGILEIIRQGGDTDTTASILGGIIGAKVGAEGIPSQWLHNLWDYPYNTPQLKQLGVSLVTQQYNTIFPFLLTLPRRILRNTLFLILVIGHGFRRLLPPY